ncbi:hypothetical protein KM427_07105 [Nocardioides sp. LMS-CY]|uniref:Uncharacterized protein n=1 Tax=Nocardioides soli TaxID=1036020 RepID=A0A7W4VT95_9ACTN|nr:DUF6113 family protein [Nocardioides sp. LMS-CY]MBB3041319.1 hypothetical protein [Nocardioides soli]QWF23479.1 hypothetical protein KM427_07105 [Nocardioides sp. LMS-CY]
MKLLAAVGLLFLGAGTGVATIAVHDLTWGLALAVAATAVTAYALPAGWWSRLAFAVGWVAMVGWLAVPRPEGDYLISQDWQGYLVLGLGMLLLVVGLATLPRPRRAATLP